MSCLVYLRLRQEKLIDFPQVVGIGKLTEILLHIVSSKKLLLDTFKLKSEPV